MPSPYEYLATFGSAPPTPGQPGAPADDAMDETPPHQDGPGHLHYHEKLRTFASPLVRCSATGDSASSHESHARSIADARAEPKHGSDARGEHPQLRRYEEPTLLEIFYDLVFAACYNVYSDTQKVTSHATFKASVGFFCLLWITWFLVTIFDVRYVTDSIFARATRAVQLGVLIGFAVVAPKFNPSEPHRDTMVAMSVILMLSRSVLVIDYAATLWHVRRYKKEHRPLHLQIALHTVAAAVYLGVSFAFKVGVRSRVYMTWYFIAGTEAIASMLLSNMSPFASLTGTHLMKRLTLLTVMIMGDGIVEVGKEVVVIVRNPDAWDSITIGLVAAAVATIYFIFLIYFDWLRSSFHLPPLRQQLWTSLHLPFHLSLVLFMKSFTQFLIWSKISSQVDYAGDILIRGFRNHANMTSLGIATALNESVQVFLQTYPPKISSTPETVNSAIRNLSSLPQSFWENFTSRSDNPDETNPDDVQFMDAVAKLVSSMYNALHAAFGIDLSPDVAKQYPKSVTEIKDGAYQWMVLGKTESRFGLVFASGYISAGCTIFFMCILAVVSRTTRMKLWPVARLVIVLLLGVGTALVATMWYNEELLGTYLLNTQWPLPTISIVWAVILILTHINGQGLRRNTYRFRRVRHDEHQSTRGGAPAAVPLTSAAAWGSGDRKRAAGYGHDAEAQPRAYAAAHGADDADGGKAAGHCHGDSTGTAFDGSLAQRYSVYDPLRAEKGQGGDGSYPGE